MKVFTILPRAASTEIAIFDGMEELLHETVTHPPSEIYVLRTPAEQGQYRFNAIIEVLSALGSDVSDLDVVISLIESRSLPPGIYMVDNSLMELLSDDVLDENPLRSGVFVTYLLSEYVSDRFDAEIIPIALEPVVEDEILQEASLSGIKGVARRPQYKSLSQRTGATFYAWNALGRVANEFSAVTVHIGSEIISVGAFERGRMIDNNCVQDGEGPFSPKSSGTLPLDALIDLCYSGQYDMDEIITTISRKSGLSAYLEDSSLERVMSAYWAGDKKVMFLVRAMACGVAKEIGAKAASLRGHVDAITVVGSWTMFEEFVEMIKSMVKWIAPVKAYRYAGESMTLALSAASVYYGTNKILIYGADRRGQQ